ncbi:aminoacyl-histidine dipeptidase [Caloranaerobacter azorensis]|uniref:Cytosol non-specific dipeptidase n=1 Tax=Caloranaerobacter azorensis TaxID=116090 RepID=A0A6P1YA76_9FIRM|nr:aminoacyl-histidine dipeptidase [Caloranaerobacter azorensis]QIB25954.1 aminoacyl-histidine dipeptidase [Caloranaerobacter azorensis]
MNYILNNLEPRAVFKYFEQISRIPRGSGNEKRISDYLVSFAKNHNLKVIQDDALNVIIKKNGTSGYENSPTVILQGHMDMVCEKDKEVEHDFEKDPLELRVDGDFIRAAGTTLGADNGIAIAYCLAILESEDIPHPPLEVVFTTEEETGMGGASALNPSNLKGKILINIDSEEEGKLLVSCAGGVRTRIILPIVKMQVDEKLNTYRIKIKGLKGGHSGMEIDKGRGNANKLMGRVLKDIHKTIKFYLANISGGAKMNAIPREAEAVILTNSEYEQKLNEKIEYWNEILGNEFKSVDSDVNVEIEKLNDTIESVFSLETTEKVIDLLVMIPNGIQTMSMEIKGLVQSSTNLGVVVVKGNEVVFESAVRSSVRSLKYDIVSQTETVAKVIGAKFVTESDYPEWQYNPDSYIRKVFVKVYKDLYGKEPEITAIHAGLECGLFKEKLGDIDMISFGPNMYDVHTPNERLSISSTRRMWNYLLAVLKEIK